LSWHYGGSAWVDLPVFTNTSGTPLPLFDSPPGLIGPRADTVFSQETTSFRGLARFDGVAWADEGAPQGRPGWVPGAMYAADANGGAIPRIGKWDEASRTWASTIATPLTSNQLAEWIGVLGTNDVFFKTVVSGGPKYVHWAGATVFNGTTTEAVFETTSIPDGTLLDAIECHAAVGCYAISSTQLWFTPGDRNSWAQQTPPAIGSMTAVVVGDAGFAALGGTQGRVARFDGTSWTVDQLPSAFSVKLLVASGPKDIFVVTQSALDDHELFHWNGSYWGRVRTPVPAGGSKIDQLWTDGRVTYFGSGQSPTHFHALVRNETW
jgi:hypothetical protein